MKKIITTVMAMIAISFTCVLQGAEEPEEAPAEPAAAPAEAGEVISVEGVICCAKCALKEAEECSDVVKVGELKYYLEEDGNVKTSVHQCRGTAKVKLSGKVEVRDGKKYIIVSEIEKESPEEDKEDK